MERQAGVARGAWILGGVAAMATCALAAGPAFAHAGHEGVSSFSAGLAHPLSGWDHLAAMVGIGVWAGQQTDRRLRLALPATFVTGVALAAAAAVAGVTAPFVEAGILLGVVLIAGLVLTRANFGAAQALALTGVLAVWHGFAHGMEAPAGSFAGFMAGFGLSTAALHAAGLALALIVARLAPKPATR
jgi:urease accessory protein